MTSKRISTIIAAIALLVLSGQALAGPVTVATFANPSPGGETPLFEVNTQAGPNIGTIDGGWSDDMEGLTLIVPLSGQEFNNAWFEMTTVEYNTSGNAFSGNFTSGGTISFYEDNADPLVTDPVIEITFESGFLSPFTIYGIDLIGQGVTISGTALENVLSIGNEAFSFGLANQTQTQTGFTATASFTSSAQVELVPEPVSLALLGAGSFLLRIRRRNG